MSVSQLVAQPLGHVLSKWLAWLGVGQAEARNLELLLLIHIGAGAQALGPASAAFPGTLAGSWIEVEQPGV